MNKPPSPTMEHLTPLIGTWHTTSEVKGDTTAPTTPLSGTDSYEWILNKHFILHRVDVRIGDNPVEALEIISPSGGEAASYSFRSFDAKAAFTEMEAPFRAISKRKPYFRTSHENQSNH